MRKLGCVSVFILAFTLHLTLYTLHGFAAEKGLVAHWSFDEGSGDVAKDKSGNGNDGKITGATYEKGKVGYCLSFDGDASVVEVPNSDALNLVNAVSIELWVKISGSNEQWQNPIRKWGDRRNYGIYFAQSNGGFAFSASYEDATTQFTDSSSGFSVWDNQWHHLAAVFDGAKQTLRLYVDGKEVKNYELGFSEMITNDASISIGDKTPGLIDEVKIYSRPLTADEVISHYRAASGEKVELKQEQKKEEAKKIEKKDTSKSVGIISNSGFEDESWWDWKDAQRVTNKYFSGKASAELEASENIPSGPWTPFIPVPRDSSSGYTVSFNYNTEIKEGIYFISVYYYDEDDNPILGVPEKKDSDHADILSTKDSSKKWVKYTYTVGQKNSGAKFILPEGTAKIKIRGCFWGPNNSCTGIAYLDDFVLEGLEKAQITAAVPAAKEEKKEVPRVEKKTMAKEEGIKMAANYGFEASENIDDWELSNEASITTDKNEIISGKASLKGDSGNSAGDWHEFFRTKPTALSLEGGKEYTVSFNYKVLSKAEDAKFYFLARSYSNIFKSDKGWTEWTDGPGSIGNKTIPIKLDDLDDYKLVMGIYKSGAMSIDDLKVWSGKPAEQKTEKSPLENLIFSARTNNKYNIFLPGEEMVLNVSFLTVEDMLNFQDVGGYKEEHQGNGDSWGKYAKDPAGGGQVVEVKYLIKNKSAQDWIDWIWNPASPLDWSNYGKLNLDVYPKQDADYLTIKLADQKGILYESSLGKLTANQWQKISVPLTKARSNIVQINFYVSCYTGAPANQEVTFYLRNMQLDEPVTKSASVKETLKGKKFVLKSEIVDFYSRKIKEDVAQIVFGEQKPSLNINIKMNNPGLYWANLSLSMGNEEIKKRIGIGVIPQGPAPKLEIDSPFGVNFMMDTELGNIAGIKWDRRGIGWRWVERTKGNFNLSGIDAMVDKAYNSGVNIMPILSSPPDWARKVPPDYKPITEGTHIGWGDFPPNDLDAWGKYVYEVVNRYKDRIKCWEIWNEPWPNCLFFNGGSIQDYVDLLKVAYEQAKKADPTCFIVGLGGTEYKHMRQVFEAGGFPYMDICSIHHYQPGPNPPESGNYLGDTAKAREVMRQFGNGKEKDLWMTEMGWPTNITDQNIRDNWVGIPEELQGKYLPRTYVLGIAAGLKKHFWFMFHNGGTDPKNFEHHQGLLYNDLTPKPSFVAYTTLTRMVGNLDYKEKLNLGGAVYGYKFEKGVRSCFVLWSLSQGATLITSKLPEGTRLTDMMGGTVELNIKEGKCFIPISDCVTYVSNDRSVSAEIKTILEKAQITGINPIMITGQKTKRLDVNRILVSIEIQNNVNRDVKGEMKIELPKGWEVSPSSLSFGPLRPAEPGNLGFIVEKIRGQETSISIPFTITVPDTGPIKGAQIIDLPVIKKAKSPMTIDGRLDEWKDCPSIPLNMPSQCTNPDKNPKDFSSVCYVAWDKNYLYFAADVADDVMSCKDIETVDFQHCDYYRLYLNLGHNAIESIKTMDSDDFEFAFTPTGPENKPMVREVSKAFGGPGHPGLDLSKIKIASTVKSTGWTFEVAIPWEILGFSPKEDSPIGIKFITGDTDADGKRKDEYVWGDKSGAYWSDPNKFGDIYFVQ